MNFAMSLFPSFNCRNRWSFLAFPTRAIRKPLQIGYHRMVCFGLLLISCSYGLTADEQHAKETFVSGNSDQAIRAIPFRKAVQLKSPYECQFTVPSLFGERTKYKAIVERNEFLIAEEDGMGLRCVKKGNVGYWWLNAMTKQNLNKYNLPPRKFDLKKIEHALSSEMPEIDRSWLFGSFMNFMEPPPEAVCRPSPSVPLITVPSLPFADATEDFLSQYRRYKRSKDSYVDSLGFDVFLPKGKAANIALEIDLDLPPGFHRGILFYYKDDAMSVTIRESKLSPSFDPPANCAALPGDPEETPSHLPCRFVLKTQRGIEIYASGSPGQYSERTHYFKMGKTRIEMSIGVNGKIDDAILFQFIECFEKVDKTFLKTKIQPSIPAEQSVRR